MILFLLKYYRENITLQIEIVQGEVDLELVKEREDALQQLEVSFEPVHEISNNVSF